MRKCLSWVLTLSLFVTASIGATTKSAGGTQAKQLSDELLALLPASDVVGVIDLPRALRELLPRLKALDLGGISKLAVDLETFAGMAGLDGAKANSAVVGLTMEGLSIRGGAIIVDGLDLDPKRIETAAAAKSWQFQKTEQAGKAVFRVARVKAPEAGGANAGENADEVYFASLGARRAVAGDLETVKGVLSATPDKGENNVVTRTAVKETKATSVVRFAAVIPEGLRQLLDSQGDLFKQLAAVKVIFGTLDLMSDQGVAVDARLRTNSNEEAIQMETGLKNLVLLGKSFLGGDNDPKLKAIGQLLDLVQLSTQKIDVALSLVIPKAMLDQWAPLPDGKKS